MTLVMVCPGWGARSVVTTEIGSESALYWMLFCCTILLLSDVSGTRTIGVNYDLLGRTGCVQDAAPVINASGACTSGTHPYVQNTYDTTFLGTRGTTDFPVGELTRSIATTYYPDSTSATVTEQFQHDQRGRPITGTMQLTWPGSWGVTTPLPTYQVTTGYNDHHQHQPGGTGLHDHQRLRQHHWSAHRPLQYRQR